MHQVVAAHHWPGRFEVAQEKPLVLLDGAHNPAAAEALAGELQRLSGERSVANTDDAWVLVVGAGTGHDAAGILYALAPVAQRVLLTSSDHPRALAPAVLADLAPDDLAVEQVPASSQALKRALDASGAQRPRLRSRVSALGGAGAGIFQPARRARRHHRRHGTGESGMCRRSGPTTGTHLRVDFGRRHSAQTVGRAASPALLAQQASLQRLRRSPARRRQGVPIRGFRRRRIARPRYAQALQPASRRALRPLQNPRHSRGNRRRSSGAVRVPPIGQKVPQLAGAGRILGAQRNRPRHTARIPLCQQRLFGQHRAGAAIRGRAGVSESSPAATNCC